MSNTGWGNCACLDYLYASHINSQRPEVFPAPVCFTNGHCVMRWTHTHTHTHTHNVCQKCFGFISYHWRARLLRDQYLITYTQMEENAILQVYNNTHTHTEELGNVTTVQRLAGPPSVAEGRKRTGDRGRCGHGGSQGSISIHKRQMNP